MDVTTNNALIYADTDQINFEDSLKLFHEFSVKSQDYKYLPPINADNKDFGSDFPGSLIHKPRYSNCRFHHSTFKASNGAFSVFKNNSLYDCHFEDANFSYSNFEGCSFEKKEQFSILATGFSFSSFSQCHFKGIAFQGISFRDVYIEDCIFENCGMNNSSFERASIKNTVFKNIDFRNIGIRYCQFSDVVFQDVVFPILDLTNNIGLISIIESQREAIRFSLGYKKEVYLEEAKSLLLGLLPYYKETQQYFPMINIFLLVNDIEKVNKLLPIALEYSVKQYDFDTLQNLCQLITNSGLFSVVQLKKFYDLIGSFIKPETFPYNLKKGYNVYMGNIKNILIDNPNNCPCATINLSTTINCKTLELIPEVIKDIEAAIRIVNPLLLSSIKLIHHSPYDILITLYGILPELLAICQTFYYAFGGIKTLSELKKSRHERAENHSQNFNANKIIEQTKSKNLTFSAGPFQFKKETSSVVKKIEYYIHD